MLLATPCQFPTVPLLLMLGPELLYNRDWSAQWLAVKVGTDGVGKGRSSALWYLGEGSEDWICQGWIKQEYGTCVYVWWHIVDGKEDAGKWNHAWMSF